MTRCDPSVWGWRRHLHSACRLAVGGLCCMFAAWAAAQDEGPTWFAGGRPREAAHQALGFLLAAEADGLAPTDYDAEGLARQLAGAEALDAAGLRAVDAALTRAMRRYLADLHGGRIDQLPSQAGQQVERDEGFDPAGLLRAALAAGRLAEAVHGAAPAQPDYPGLRPMLPT